MAHGKSPKHIRKPRPKAVEKKPSTSKQVGTKTSTSVAGSIGRSVRLQKLLAAAGFGSRRDVEQYIVDQRVTVNGRTSKIGDSADPGVDEIRLDGEVLEIV